MSTLKLFTKTEETEKFDFNIPPAESERKKSGYNLNFEVEEKSDTFPKSSLENEKKHAETKEEKREKEEILSFQMVGQINAIIDSKLSSFSEFSKETGKAFSLYKSAAQYTPSFPTNISGFITSLNTFNADKLEELRASLTEICAELQHRSLSQEKADENRGKLKKIMPKLKKVSSARERFLTALFNISDVLEEIRLDLLERDDSVEESLKKEETEETVEEELRFMNFKFSQIEGDIVNQMQRIRDQSKTLFDDILVNLNKKLNPKNFNFPEGIEVKKDPNSSKLDEKARFQKYIEKEKKIHIKLEKDLNKKYKKLLSKKSIGAIGTEANKEELFLLDGQNEEFSDPFALSESSIESFSKLEIPDEKDNDNSKEDKEITNITDILKENEKEEKKGIFLKNNETLEVDEDVNKAIKREEDFVMSAKKLSEKFKDVDFDLKSFADNFFARRDVNLPLKVKSQNSDALVRWIQRYREAKRNLSSKDVIKEVPYQTMAQLDGFMLGRVLGDKNLDEEDFSATLSNFRKELGNEKENNNIEDFEKILYREIYWIMTKANKCKIGHCEKVFNTMTELDSSAPAKFIDLLVFLSPEFIFSVGKVIDSLDFEGILGERREFSDELEHHVSLLVSFAVNNSKGNVFFDFLWRFLALSANFMSIEKPFDKWESLWKTLQKRVLTEKLEKRNKFLFFQYKKIFKTMGFENITA